MGNMIPTECDSWRKICIRDRPCTNEIYGNNWTI